MIEEKIAGLKKEEVEQLDLWVKQMLPTSKELEADKKYVDIKNQNKDSRTTHVRDSIWGNIELQEQEIILLSTPLMQRLRRIKQLSSAHLSFPGATHTRFEHSLGVLEQTERMCQWLKRNKPGCIRKRQHNNLRFAALCHDLGHGPFSHASEAFFKTLPPFDREDMEIGSAELLSGFIVRSKHFIDFCQKLPGDIDTEFIANAIIGGLPAKYRHLGSIIKGPFDADKIDYLIRDGHYCGIPIDVDVEVIYRSLTVDGERNNPQLMGKAKAAPPLIQLVRFRQYMFSAVYHYKVARIFDAMFAKAMKCAHEDGDTAINGEPLKTAFDFLELDNEMLLTPGIVTEGTAAADLLGRLRNRNLFKVALELGDHARCQECKRLKQHGHCSGCKRYQEDWKQKREDIKEACAKIAKKAKIKSHQVLFAEAPTIKYDEAKKMILSKDDKPIELEKILDLSMESESLQGFMEKDLLCCPVEHVEEVNKIAQKMLG